MKAEEKDGKRGERMYGCTAWPRLHKFQKLVIIITY